MRERLPDILAWTQTGARCGGGIAAALRFAPLSHAVGDVALPHAASLLPRDAGELLRDACCELAATSAARRAAVCCSAEG